MSPFLATETSGTGMAAIRPRTVLLTGGTGFLGSHLGMRLLSDGHRVLFLARGRNRQRPEDRVKRLLDWFELPPEPRRRLEVLKGSLDEPGLGLSERDHRSVLEKVEETVHCASDTSFAARKRDQVERTNLQGLSRLLDLLQQSPCRSLHLISTAYVAGQSSGPCPEDVHQPPGFHNVYEETKFEAERLARKRCAETGLSLQVYRPSIVYGDARSGRTLIFNALYYPIRTVHYFQKLYTRDLRDNNGRKARAMGVHFQSDGRLHLPLRLSSRDEQGINLIPVDHFVRAFMAIREAGPPEGGVFHIVNPANTSLERITDYTRRFFGLSGIRLAPPEDFRTRPRNGLEVLFDKHIQAYGPYLQDTRIFEHARTSALLAERGIVCPEFSYDIYAACMGYALDVDWGRGLFPEADTRA